MTLGKNNSAGGKAFYLSDPATLLSGDTIDFKNAQFFDLTQMFGSTIADYIYSLETASAGSGIAKLKSWGFFTEDYYEYSAPTLKSVEGLSAHVMKDADENIVTSYPLDSTLTLRGIPKLDTDNELYYDGDEYASDGSVKRKYALIDPSNSSTYTNVVYNVSSNGTPYVDLKAPNLKQNNAGFSNAYTWKNTSTTKESGIFCVYGTEITVYDSNFTSASQAIELLTANNVVFIVESATPTSETADPYVNPQIVDSSGTEEYVTTSIIPVGHITKYPDNLRERLDNLPDTLNEVGNRIDATTIHNTASGAIASFADGAYNILVDDLKVSIEPVQDLNGYDSPWPAGGGVNKIDVSKLRSYGTTYGLTTSFDGDWIVLSGTYTNSSATANFRIATLSGSAVFPVTSFKAFPDSNSASHMSAAPFGLADGNATLTIYIYNMGQGETYNLRTKIVGYEGSTAPTVWTPYSNICPIIGWTSVNVTRTGKNLFKESAYQNIKTNYDYVSGSYVCRIIDLEPNTTYMVSQRAGTADSTGLILLNRIPQVNESGYFDCRLTFEQTVFTTGEAGKLYIGAYMTENSAYNARLNLCKIQIEKGSTASPYEPYTGTTYLVTLPSSAGTVYGGTLDVTNGVLTVDRAITTVGALTWGSINGIFYSNTFSDLREKGASNIICSSYATSNVTSWSSVEDKRVVGNIANGNIYIKDTTYNDVGSFTSAMSGVQLVYELATPQTYQLTPTEIKTLLGVNNIWADTGDSDVEYCANTQLYIEQLTKPTEDDMIANSAIASGKYFFVNNRLFLSTASIANGAMIIPGNNCTETNIAEALNTLNS